MTMVHQVVWMKCNIFSKDGEPTVYNRGDLLPDGVDDIQLEQLRVIGAIRVMESVPTEEELAAQQSEPVSSPSGELVKPSTADPKPAWIAYAIDARNPNRVSEQEANAMSKTALMERYQN